MKQAIDKIIRNYIMVQYPEIKDFSFAIYKETQGGKLPIVIVYYMDLKDFGGYALEVHDKCGEIADFTTGVYKMIDDGKHVILNIMCKDLKDR